MLKKATLKSAVPYTRATTTTTTNLESMNKQQIPAQFNKILIVGLGQLGLPVAKYVKERGFDAYGYDISPKAMDRAEKTAAIKKLLILVNLMYIFCVYQLINLKICSHLK